MQQFLIFLPLLIAAAILIGAYLLIAARLKASVLYRWGMGVSFVGERRATKTNDPPASSPSSTACMSTSK